MDGKIYPRKGNLQMILVWVRLYFLPLDYWLHTTLNFIGDSLGKFIKISQATLQGRYTTYAKICVEMNVSGALPVAVKLEFRDEFWLQLVDYEQIPFICCR